MSKCTVCIYSPTVRMIIFIRLFVFVPVENGIEPAADPQSPADKSRRTCGWPISGNDCSGRVSYSEDYI